jgi:hypothetical protein
MHLVIFKTKTKKAYKHAAALNSEATVAQESQVFQEACLHKLCRVGYDSFLLKYRDFVNSNLHGQMCMKN